MYLFRGPWIDYAIRTLVENRVVERVGVEMEYESSDSPVAFVKHSDEHIEHFPRRYQLRQRLRSLMQEADLKMQPGPPSPRQERLEATDLYLRQNPQEDPALVNAVALTIDAYGRHKDIYLGPLLGKLNEITTPLGMETSKALIRRMEEANVATVRETDSGNVLRMNENSMLVQFLRSSMNIRSE